MFPTQQGRLTHLNVTIAATTLAGLDDLPGDLDGYGPISADLCRTLAVSASSITAIGVDPTCGTALEVGRTTYRPRCPNGTTSPNAIGPADSPAVGSLHDAARSTIPRSSVTAARHALATWPACASFTTTSRPPAYGRRCNIPMPVSLGPARRGGNIAPKLPSGPSQHRKACQDRSFRPQPRPKEVSGAPRLRPPPPRERQPGIQRPQRRGPRRRRIQ